VILNDIFFELSVRNVRLHFLRSLLAAVGITIGVLAISSIGMMGANLQLSVSEELSSTGNVIIVTPYSGGGNGGFGGGTTSSSGSYISEKQLRDISSASGTNTVIPLYSTADLFSYGGEDNYATIYGIEKDKIADIATIEDGTLFSGSSGALVGPSLAETNDLKVGSRIKIGDEDKMTPKTVRVTGILEEKGMGIDINTDYAIIIEDKLYTSMYENEGHYDQANVYVNDIDTIENVMDDIDRKLNKRDKEVVRIYDSGSFLETINQTIGTISLFVTAIGGISLVVAAVSIFNVMMMSVTERIQEIGILRSIGTRKSEIRRMFLYEAFILGFIGSIIGGLLSFLGGYAIVAVMIQTTEYFFRPESLMYVPLGMVVGIIICVLSGIYPAWKAANLDPIDALRNE
jgi:putative ABC transport system permease protein